MIAVKKAAVSARKELKVALVEDILPRIVEDLQE
jgi:hypothetical protein